jgi:DNA-3-methyladenine glycosylase
MFGPPGHAYVFMIYGFWFCMNIVTEPEGCPCAVLLRAIEPVDGLDGIMTAGPGLLCKAMGIDRGLDGADLLGDSLFLERPRAWKPVRMGVSARIGVDYAGSWARRKWRFFDRDSLFVSGRPTARRSRAKTPSTRQSRASR